MNKMRNLISILFGLLALAALAAGLAWLFGTQGGALPGQQVSPVRTPTPGLKETPTPMRYVEPTAPSEDWPTLTPPPTRVMPTRGTPVVKPSPTPVPIPTRPPLLLTPILEGNPPDGLQSLYYVAETEKGPDIRAIGMDVQGRRWPESVVTSEVLGMNLAGLYPSPDGQYLALELVSPMGGYCEVKVMERSSGRIWCPFDDPARCWGSFWDWTPENHLLFYPSGEQPDDIIRNFWMVDINAGQHRVLDLPIHPHYGYSLIYNASISPDGSRLAYSITYAENEEEISEIWIMRVDSGDKQLVRRVKGVINGRTLSWSPVDERLIYLFQGPRGKASTDPAELWLLNADGSGEVLLGDDVRMAGERRYSPVWSPDGRYVAFVQVDDPTLFLDNWREPGTNVYVADTLTGQVTRLSTFEARNTSFPTWSPDGKFVAFVSTIIVSEETLYGEVWVASVYGSHLYAVSGMAKPNNALAWLPSVPFTERR